MIQNEQTKTHKQRKKQTNTLKYTAGSMALLSSRSSTVLSMPANNPSIKQLYSTLHQATQTELLQTLQTLQTLN